MTEEEAETKWCPFARSRFADINIGGGKGKYAVLLDDDEKINLYCIGSRCMAWRWIDRNVRDFGAKGDHNQETGEGTDDTEAFQRAIDAERHGYCGLAGKL